MKVSRGSRFFCCLVLFFVARILSLVSCFSYLASSPLVHYLLELSLVLFTLSYVWFQMEIACLISASPTVETSSFPSLVQLRSTSFLVTAFLVLTHHNNQKTHDSYHEVIEPQTGSYLENSLVKIYRFFEAFRGSILFHFSYNFSSYSNLPSNN